MNVEGVKDEILHPLFFEGVYGKSIASMPVAEFAA
jgi:hypothetical protein